jgi:CHAT domain-containing protein/Flp pilus assembly protein TadD
MAGASDSDALNDQGVRYAAQGRYSEAETALRQALALRESRLGPDSPFVAQTVYNLGYVYRLEGRYAEAEPLLRRALTIRERVLPPGDPAFARTLNELGYLYQVQGRAAEAEPMYKRALDIQRRAPAPDDLAISGTLNNLGYLYRTVGRYPEAEAAYKSALAIREAAPGDHRIEVAQVVDNLGTLDRLQGRNAEAEPLLRRALALREATLGADHPDIADSLRDLGDLMRVARRWNEAEPLLQRALAIQQKTLGADHPYVATQSLGSLVRLYQAEGNLGAALQASNQATAILERHLIAGASQRSASASAEHRLYRGDLLTNIALLYAGRGGDSVARSFEVAQLADASTTGQAVTAMAARFAAGSDGLAAAVRERADLGDRWQQLDAAIIRTASRPQAERNPGEEATLRSSFADTERQLQAAEAKIARDFPAYAGLTSPAPLPAQTVQRLLAPDEAMLVYVVGEDASWLWALRNNRAALYRLDIGAAALAAEVTALRARLDPWQNETMQPFPATRAYALYQRILGPAASFLQDAKHVLVVPDGALQSLPISVLVTLPPGGDPATLPANRNVAWFARDHATTVLPSVRALQALRVFAARSRASSPFTGIGNPTLEGPGGAQRAARQAAMRGLGPVASRPFGVRQASLFRGGTVDVEAVKELPPLPETAGELRTIGRALGASDDDLYLGSRASEPVIRSARLERYRVIEFATHGLMSGDLGLGEPALVLTPPDVATSGNDGLLTASKIATMKFDADWIVLSACNTAAGDGTPDAGGLSGLAKAFFYAGARSLLVSHWSVPSVATVKLTTGAFAELARDPSIGRAEALRRSMMAMLDPSNPPELSHPMAWAPFVLAGEGGPGR